MEPASFFILWMSFAKSLNKKDIAESHTEVIPARFLKTWRVFNRGNAQKSIHKSNSNIETAYQTVTSLHVF